MNINTLENLLKISEILEQKHQYTKADMITNFIKKAILEEEIDWTQPNAYMTYMDALKNKTEDTTENKQITKNKKNPTLTRLQNGFYSDIPVSELAKLANSLGFEVVSDSSQVHFKFIDKSGKLKNSPNEKYKSGIVTIGGHKKNQKGIADYLGIKDFVGALKFLGHL